MVVTPSCNSISISPTSGTTPLNSSVSCNTTNATSVSIACGNGQVINNSNGICNYTTIGTFAPRCTVNGSITNTACTASVTTTPPVTTPPVCNPAKTGVQSTPVSSTDTLCSIGTVSGFTAIGSNPINYTWSCNDTTSIACTANYTPPVASTPSLSIKKYVKTLGAAGDTQSAPISVALGETFNYYYQLQNTGSVAATGVIVKDTLPAYLTFTGSIVITNPAGTDVTSDWTCVK